MKSKNLQLMLLSGALTVSFAAQAAEIKNNSIVKDNNDGVVSPMRNDVTPVNNEMDAEEIAKSTDANVYGHVVDAKTGEHVPYVIIQVKGTTIATTTDMTGHFFLKNLPEGSFIIEAKYMGYTSQSKSVTIRKNATKELNFSLNPNDLSLDEVVVSANRNETQRRLAPNLVNVIGGEWWGGI